MEVIEMEKTDVKGLKPIESKGIDLSQFEGQRVKIESVEVIEVPTKFGNSGNGESEVLKVQSVPVANIQDRDGNDIPVRASELFNLGHNADGELGWPTGPKGKLAGFLKRLGVGHPSQLVGKQVAVRIRAKKGTDGTTREFLGFITD
jgi:hypothetical protein